MVVLCGCGGVDDDAVRGDVDARDVLAILLRVYAFDFPSSSGVLSHDSMAIFLVRLLLLCKCGVFDFPCVCAEKCDVVSVDFRIREWTGVGGDSHVAQLAGVSQRGQGAERIRARDAVFVDVVRAVVRAR